MAIKNPAGKTRKIENPYASWIDPRTGWECRLLKSWQGDNSKEYARWFVAVKSPMTWGSFEMGDEYVGREGMRYGLRLALEQGTAWWDEQVWETAGELMAWIYGEK